MTLPRPNHAAPGDAGTGGTPTDRGALPAAGAAPSPARARVLGSAEAVSQAASLREAGRVAEAEALLKAAIARDPGNADLRNARGVMFAAMGRPLDALWCYREAIALGPDAADTWSNLGNALAELNHPKSAVACHRRALALSGGALPLFHQALGSALAEAGRHGEAVAAFSRAVDLDPRRLMLRWERARSHLYLGHYRQAWPDYEVRRFTGQLPRKQLPGKAWTGQPYAGKRLVLVAEQGLGDTLWAARYLARVKALGGELAMECQPELIPLIDAQAVVDRLVPRDEPLPEADYHCYLCSLPGLFTPDLAAIPNAPYLGAPGERLATFAPLFLQAAGRLKVGILWSGSAAVTRDEEGAQSLLRFAEAFALPGVQLYSLQKGPRAAELTLLPRGGPAIIDLSPHIQDFADTAAAIAGLDLVIMTDGAVAHLAGSMGRPVWVLLGQGAHWLWLLDRTDSPWYPAMRLFRPRGKDDWDDIFDSASAELMAMAKI